VLDKRLGRPVLEDLLFGHRPSDQGLGQGEPL
jgi:hypothetical protein